MQCTRSNVVPPVLLAIALVSGCKLPEVGYEPQVLNPFPQLAKVAVAPFFNLTTTPTVDGRQFALAYFNELQLVPGFEVVPVGVVEQAMLTHQIGLNSPADARRLAQLLGVDAVVVGAVSDFSPYYPPRCALKVEWYSANPCYHPIPPGYGLPWGTPLEEEIPDSLIFQSEFALARAQLETQSPAYMPEPVPPPVPMLEPVPDPADGARDSEGIDVAHRQPLAPIQEEEPFVGPDGQPLVPPEVAAIDPPHAWPDPRGFIPRPPHCGPEDCVPCDKPVLQHVKTYNGQDSFFTTALQNYVFFHEDERAGGWKSYLERSDDFIRFCCHLHIAEMLTARGGAGETRVVYRWPDRR